MHEKIKKALKNPVKAVNTLFSIIDEISTLKVQMHQISRQQEKNERELANYRAIFSHFRKPLIEYMGAELYPGSKLLLDPPPADPHRITTSLLESGVCVKEYNVDDSLYQEYLNWADYQSFKGYCRQFSGSLDHKMMQHYLSYKLLDINPSDVYMDVASSASIFTDILHKQYPKMKTYRQDLTYEEGVHGDMVGSNAKNIPLPDNSIDKMGLHCSFEHFEGDADTGFIRDAARLLAPNGKVCIIPLYISEQHHILTNEQMWVTHWQPMIEPGENLFFKKDPVNVYGRFYSPKSLVERIIDTVPELRITLYRFTNHGDFAGCPGFAMVLEKLAENEK